MSEPRIREKGELALLAEAALWHERLAAGDDPRAVDGFDRWIATSPAHTAAFADTAATLRLMKQVADEPAMLGLRQHTLARLARRQERLNWRPAALAAGLACLLAGSIALWNIYSPGEPAASPPREQFARNAATVHSTSRGKMTSIHLADGSRVTLNPLSRLRVAFSGKERRLVLESGQAFFDVAKDTSRPFIVEAAGQVVVAHGTQFDVRIRERSLRIALLEGSVSVRWQAGSKRDTVRLRPNDVLTASDDAVTVHHQDNVQALASWREGLLIFRDDELIGAVQEMNRYDTTRIVVADDRIANLRISGAFRAGEAMSFVQALEVAFPIRAAVQDDGRIVLQGK